MSGHDGFASFAAERLAQGDLPGIRARRLELCRGMLEGETSSREMCATLTGFNRAVIRAVMAAHERDYPWLVQCSFLEFGSGGRGEQVPGSDQDNGLLVRGDPPEDELEDAGQQIVMALDGAGLMLCPGDVMLSNARWRGHFDQWIKRLAEWISNPVENGPWESGLILDFESLTGPGADGVLLKDRLWDYVRTRPAVLKVLVDEMTGYRLPLTLFGAFITEKTPPWEGCLDIKHSVLAHLTNGVRLLALKYSLTPSNTHDRITALAEEGHISTRHGQELAGIWDWIQRKRFEIGVRTMEQGGELHNYLDPRALDREEKKRLKAGIQAVEKLVRLVQAGAGL